MASAWLRILKAAKKAYDLVDKANTQRGRLQGADRLKRSSDPKDAEKAIRDILALDSPMSDAIEALT